MFPFLEPKRATASILGGTLDPTQESSHQATEEMEPDLKELAMKALAHEMIQCVQEGDARGLSECLNTLAEVVISYYDKD